MNEINKRNILSHWGNIVEADFGSLVTPKARQILCFFEDIIESDYGNGWHYTSEVPSDSYVAGLLRGFQINNQYYTEDGLNLMFSLNLHCVGMTDRMIEEFSDYLLNTVYPHSSALSVWGEYLMDTIREEEASKKKNRKRRK